MQTHRDDDHGGIPDSLKALYQSPEERLEEKAKQMRKAGESAITGGKDDEPELERFMSEESIAVFRRPADHDFGTRISLGSGEGAFDGCRYLTYRGEPGDVLRMLTASVKAMQEHMAWRSRL